VLSTDILKIDPAEIDNAKVILTVFDGKVIYRRQ
jgi:predicted amidohydrolase YtcJ